MEEKNNTQKNLFYYFIPMVIDKDLSGEAIDLKIESEYLKGNVLSILDQCKYIKSSFNLIKYLNNPDIEKNINCLESGFYSFKNLCINENNKFAKLKYLCLKVEYKLNEIDKIIKYNRIVFKALAKIDAYFKENKLEGISKCYKPRVLSILFIDDLIDNDYDHYSQVSNLLSNCSDDRIIKTKTERIHLNTLFSTSIRGGNLIKSSNDYTFIDGSFENNYKSLFLLALNQIMICEYENDNVTEFIKKYDKNTDNKNMDNIIVNIKRQIATYFFDVTTNVVNINLFYRDLLVNFVLEPSQKELVENVEILNSLVCKNMEIRRSKHEKYGRVVLAAQAVLLIILAVLQVVKDEYKLMALGIGIPIGIVLLVFYAIFINNEK